jgi:hypothetical protein
MQKSYKAKMREKKEKKKIKVELFSKRQVHTLEMPLDLDLYIY